MALDWTNKINNVDNVDANDVNTLAAAIKDLEQAASNLTNGDGMSSVMLKTAAGAISEGAVAFGKNSIAGSKCFNITAFDDANKAYTLDSVEGLAVGDVFSLKLFNNYENIGKITAINGNVVSVDNYQANEESDVKYFRVPSKPTCGTTDFGIAAFAEGENCKAIGPNSHASGLNTIANGVCAHTEGRETTANYASHAEGGWTNANGQYAHTEGNSTEADANFAHAEGYQSKVTELGPMGHAEGMKTIVSAQAGHAEGGETVASGLYSHAEGYKTTVSAQAGHAEGDGATATGYASHAEGYKTKAANTYAHAEGKEVNASGYTSHAEGYKTISSGVNTHAEGDSTTASGERAHSEGYYSKAIGECSHAEGKETVASGAAAHSEGWQATASGAYSHAEGYSSATKQYAHSEGYYTKASGVHSHAENNKTTASGIGAHAEGYKTVAQGDYSHAEGNNNTVTGAYSHVEGKDNTVSGDCSHAENAGNEATGKYSHAEGWVSKAQGIASHAENYSIAQGDYSHSEGYGTSADSENQHVQGKYNIKDIANKYAHIVGNGTSDTARSNAHTLDWDGNAWYAGDVESEKYGKLSEKAKKSDLNAENITSVYSSKLEPNKVVNKPDFPKMTGKAFLTDIAGVTDIGGAYVPTFAIDYVWEQEHYNITSTTYFVNYDTGSSSATGLTPGAALKYPSDAMTKAKNGDTIVIMGGYYPRNQLGFDQNKSVHIQGGIFCNADNNRSLTWTLVEGTTYKTTRSQAFSVYQANDDGSAFTKFINTSTLDICKSIHSSYFIDGDTVYVNTPDGYSGAPGYDILVSLNTVGATINTNVWCENTTFVFGGQAACLNRSSTDPALFSGCIFKYAKQNGFMSQGGKSYLLNCESYNNGRDGFNYKKLNSNVSYGFEVGCTAHHNGDDESTGSDNGSTAHDGSIVTRINGKYYENKGPNIADVNPGTMSYNLNCACSNSIATAQDRQIDFNIEDGTMYLDRCTSDGSFISLYEASVTIPQTTKSYNLGSVLPGVYRVKEIGGVAENLHGGEDIANKVKSISSSSTDVQYPSAKAVNDVVSEQKTDIAQNYANALKGKVSGNNAVRIDDSSPIEHEMNVRVSSKNLLPYPYYQTTKTSNGITFTDNGDGTITANGTATATAYFVFIENEWDNSLPLRSGTYTLSGCTGGSNDTYYMVCQGKTSEESTLTSYIYNISNPKSATLESGRYIFQIIIRSGTTLSNVVFKPQLERGTTATDYTPYVDPTSVTLSECGKNLIPYPYTSSTVTSNGITFTANDDGTITVNGTATRVANFQLVAQKVLPFRKGEYTLSSGLTTDSQSTTFGLTLGYKYANGTRQTLGTINGEKTITLTADALCDFVITVRANQTLNNVIFKPQFELGSVATEYEVYKTPKTSTPSADGTVTGIKNIYPTTSLLSNKDNVVIDVEYNRDINKAFEELQNAILSQGGNV